MANLTKIYACVGPYCVKVGICRFLFVGIGKRASFTGPSRGCSVKVQISLSATKTKILSSHRQDFCNENVSRFG
jgi:hypothetical protein